MSSPTPIITPPPKRPKSFDWTNWTRKLSTMVAALAVSVAGLCGTVLTYYNGLTPEQQAGWPWWLPLALTLAPGVVAAFGPVAVAFRQSFLESPDTDSGDLRK